jgi:hypothetical protein
MTTGEFSHTSWEDALIAEARRDVVFVFNITSCAFGGPRPTPAEDDLPGLVERVASALLDAGCKVGYGVPGTDDVIVPERLRVPPGRLAKDIARFYADEPEQAKFLAFVDRTQRGDVADA